MDFISKIRTKTYLINIFYLFSASLCFSLMTVCVKLIDSKISIYQLVFFRSLFSLIITSLILQRKKIDIWGRNKPLLILRGLLGTIALMCIFYAIRNMPLSIATVIQYTYPIFISIFASFIIKEKITLNIIFGLLFGWSGIFIIINPYQSLYSGLALDHLAILIAFCGAISTSLAYITVKRLSFDEDVFVIIKYFPLISIIILSPLVYLYWITPKPEDILWIIGIGIFTQAGQTFLTIGLKNLPATQASTINYMQVLFASIWGIYIFNERISVNFIIGSSFVLIATMFSTRKMRKRNYNNKSYSEKL